MTENNQNTSSSNQNATTTATTNAAANQVMQGSAQQPINNPQVGYQQGFAQNQLNQSYQPNYQQGLNQGLQQQGYLNPQINNQVNAPEVQGIGQLTQQQQEDMMTTDQRARYNEMISKVSAKQMVDLAPALDTYIKQDLEEKATLSNRNKVLYEENQKLKGELQRLANITLLSKHQFNTHDYDIVLKLCDYVVTDEKLLGIAKDWRFNSLRNKRAEQKANQIDTEAGGLFDEIMGVKRK